MEHFSRLLPLKDSGQEFTRSNQVNVSSGSNVVPQREGGERDVGTEPRNALGGAARVLLRHWAALLSMVARSGYEIPRLPVWGLACQGRGSWFVPRFFDVIFRRKVAESFKRNFLRRQNLFERFLIPMDGWNGWIGFTLNIAL